MCSTEQNSLVFIDIDSLTFNETALQQLGLLESQVLVILIRTRKVINKIS